MVLALLRLLVAGALVFVVPGYLLVRALWPPAAPGSPGPVARGVLSVVLSMSLTILVGVLLGFLPHEDASMGWLQTSATGLPFAEGLLVALSTLFIVIGMARGAYSRSRA